jgi:hypothetical protein
MKNQTRYIPSGYELIAKDERYGFECWGNLNVITNSGKHAIYAIAYGGKRTKSDWHYRFKDESSLQRQIEQTLRGYMQSAELKAEWKAKRNAPHDVKVGDIFKCSWGYDQTNIDFYECIAVLGQMIEIREIAQDSMETLSMQGECVPMQGAFIGEPMRKRVSMGGGEPSVRIQSYCSAYRMKPLATIGNKPVFASSHWTAYA